MHTTSSSFRAAIAAGLGAIREEFDVPGGFGPEVVREAAEAVRDRSVGDRVDLTHLPFVTLDPAESTDLDQAFALERHGDAVRLHYAIADVGAFVRPGSALDAEAWRRGSTVYLPDARSPVYPPALSEGAASLLPDGPRPAIVLEVDVDPAGDAVLRTARRAMVRSRAKLAYETVTDDDLPPLLSELAARVTAAEDRRGAGRIEFPEQEVEEVPGGYRVTFRRRRPSEDANATLSLAANLAVAAALLDGRTGLFRTMPGPDDRDLAMLRRTARGLDLEWPRRMELTEFQRRLPDSPAASAFLLAVRRAGGGAAYEPFREGAVPWHAAIAATYAHATAPLRRLADRYVLEAVLALTAGRRPPAWAEDSFEELPEAMRRADVRAAKVERAVVDLVEAATLHGHEGERFTATVTDLDERGARIQLTEPAVVARLDFDDAPRRSLEPGLVLQVELRDADPTARRLVFVAAPSLPTP